MRLKFSFLIKEDIRIGTGRNIFTHIYNIVPIRNLEHPQPVTFKNSGCPFY